MPDGELVRRKHKQQERHESRFSRIWRSYGLELIGLAAVALGVFLVLERMSIRETLARWAHEVARRLFSGFRHLDGDVGTWLARVSFSDLVGAVLIVAAVVVIVARMRWRLLNDAKLTSGSCPKCGGPIHRVHRTSLDRVICVFVPVRRYRCRNSDCRWRGLRVGKHHEATQSRAGSLG